MQGMVRIVSSLSRRRKIGERCDAEGGRIAASERAKGYLALLQLKIVLVATFQGDVSR